MVNDPTNTMSKPRVSVLMCAYNAQGFIRESIESVLAQTFDQFELIVVDDASTDQTTEVVKSYTDPRIVLIRNRANLGPSASANGGIEIARGEYLARLDADDLSDPERLAEQVSDLDEHPAIAILGTATLHIDEGGKPWKLTHPQASPAETAWMATFASPLVHSSIMMRTDVLRSLGGYDPKLPCALDYDLLVRALMAGQKLKCLGTVLTRYRHSSSQITSTRRAEQSALALSIQKRYVDWLLEASVEEERLMDVRRLLCAVEVDRIVDVESSYQLARQILDRCLRGRPNDETEAIQRLFYSHLMGAVQNLAPFNPRKAAWLFNALVARRPSLLTRPQALKQVPRLLAHSLRRPRSPRPA